MGRVPVTVLAREMAEVEVVIAVMGTVMPRVLEEVEEAMYRIDRSLFHITSNADIRRVSGLMLGRCSAITRNDPEFGMNEEEIARYWCQRSGIPWLGRADIGHDANNKIVPFGSFGMTEPRE